MQKNPVPLPPLYYATPRGQCAVMLMAALEDLFVKDGFGVVTKRQAIDFITARHWFSLREEDRQPYPSQEQVSAEPRWHTLIAWARKDSVLRDLISYETRDAWGLTRLGREAFDRDRRLCETGAQSVAPCFLWSAEFKKHMCAGYVPSADDLKRPRWFYRDIAPVPEKYREKAEAIIVGGTWGQFAEKYREVVGKDFGAWVPRASSEHDADRLARMVYEYIEVLVLRSVGL